MMQMQFHHTGCLVSSIDESVETYSRIFGPDKISSKVKIGMQGVYVCFIEVGPGSFLELIEGVDEQSVVYKLMKRNTTYYHNAYTTRDFDATLAMLDAIGARHMNTFISEAFENKRCAFLYLPDGCLIELIEK
jgi:methylmalonyl-CoA/ethylmalonyl-CoA epimerase